MTMHRLTRVATALACFLTVSFLGSHAQAGLTAYVVKVTGKAEFRTAANIPWQELKEKTTLNQAATIRTGEAASVTLAIGTKGSVVMHELSTLTLAALKEETPLKQDIQLSLDVGKLWSKLTKKDPNDKTTMSVRTSMAIGSVRGTSFYVEANPESNRSCFGVWEGVVQVDALATGGVQQKLEAGFFIELGELVTDNTRGGPATHTGPEVQVAGMGGNRAEGDKGDATLAQRTVTVGGGLAMVQKAKDLAAGAAADNLTEEGDAQGVAKTAGTAPAAAPAAVIRTADKKAAAAPSRLIKMGKSELEQRARFEQALKAAGI